MTEVDGVPFEEIPVPGNGMALNSPVMETAVGSGPLVELRKGTEEKVGPGSVTFMVDTGPTGRIENPLLADDVDVTSDDASDDAPTPGVYGSVIMTDSLGKDGTVVITTGWLGKDGKIVITTGWLGKDGTVVITDVPLGVDEVEVDDSAGVSSSSLFQPKMRAKKSLITSSPVRDLNASSTFWNTLFGSSPTLARRAAETSAGSCSPSVTGARESSPWCGSAAALAMVLTSKTVVSN